MHSLLKICLGLIEIFLSHGAVVLEESMGIERRGVHDKRLGIVRVNVLQGK